LEAKVPVEQIVGGWKSDLSAFEAMRKKYLLYK
jgi:uncharacterized protein YbbC (DUF1343 family)